MAITLYINYKLKKPGLNFWYLSAILGTALGFPAMIVGEQLAQKYGAGSAVLSICIGNLILWIIGLGITSMTGRDEDAIDNIKDYLGKRAAGLAAFVLAPAFIVWYAIQIKAASSSLLLLNPSYNVSLSHYLLIGGALGLLVATLSLLGLKAIKYICVISLPLLLLFCFFILVFSKASYDFSGTWKLSFFGILTVIGTWLPGMVNLPTFFRHSSTKEDSLLALSLFTILHVFFQLFTVFRGVSDPSIIALNFTISDHFSFKIFTAIVVLLAFSTINLVNIYYASAGWDALIKKHKGTIKFFVIGLTGTFFYLFTESFNKYVKFSVRAIEESQTNIISILGVVLLVDYLISVSLKNSQRNFQKYLSVVCWMLGVITSIISQIYISVESNTALVIGISISLLSFLVILFIKETFWSIRGIKADR